MSRVRAPSPALVLAGPQGCRAAGAGRSPGPRVAGRVGRAGRRAARVAQSVEHTLGKGEVTGSIPVASSGRTITPGAWPGCGYAPRGVRRVQARRRGSMGDTSTRTMYPWYA